VIETSDDITFNSPGGSPKYARDISQGCLRAPMAAKSVRAGVEVCLEDWLHEHA
jgi:hypothetical protein